MIGKPHLGTHQLCRHNLGKQAPESIEHDASIIIFVP